MKGTFSPDVDLTLLHSEWPKLYGVLAILSAVGLKCTSGVTRKITATFIFASLSSGGSS